MRTRILVVAAAFAVGFVACGDDGPQSPVNPSGTGHAEVALDCRRCGGGARDDDAVHGHRAILGRNDPRSDGQRVLVVVSKRAAAPRRGRTVPGVRGRRRTRSGQHARQVGVLSRDRRYARYVRLLRERFGTRAAGVENVVVEVTSGTGTGLITKSTFNGRYALFGVAGVVGLRASAPGYTTRNFRSRRTATAFATWTSARSASRSTSREIGRLS